jgi:hypothetical protein
MSDKIASDAYAWTSLTGRMHEVFNGKEWVPCPAGDYRYTAWSHRSPVLVTEDRELAMYEDRTKINTATRKIIERDQAAGLICGGAL